MVPVFNVDGTANTAGSISEVAELILRFNFGSSRAHIAVQWTLGASSILGDWTQKATHDPGAYLAQGTQPGSKLADWEGRDVALLTEVL